MAKFKRQDALDYHSQGRAGKIEVIIDYISYYTDYTRALFNYHLKKNMLNCNQSRVT